MSEEHEKFTEERLAELGAGYDLDGGGQAFENAPAAVFGPLVAIERQRC